MVTRSCIVRVLSWRCWDSRPQHAVSEMQGNSLDRFPIYQVQNIPNPALLFRVTKPFACVWSGREKWETPWWKPTHPPGLHGKLQIKKELWLKIKTRALFLFCFLLQKRFCCQSNTCLVAGIPCDNLHNVNGSNDHWVSIKMYCDV